MRLERPQWFEVIDYWPSISDGVAAALKHGRDIYTPSDILRELLSRNMSLWVAREEGVIQGFAITQVMKYPHITMLHLLITSGEDWHEWRHFISDIELEAARIGCNGVEFCGRAGWKRRMEPEGYEVITTLYRKTFR